MEPGLPRWGGSAEADQRTEVPELSNFVLTRTRADVLGMPVRRVLKTSATERRSKRLQRTRETAANRPMRILVTLILFLFHAICVMLPGPAASAIDGAFA